MAESKVLPDFFFANWSIGFHTKSWEKRCNRETFWPLCPTVEHVQRLHACFSHLITQTTNQSNVEILYWRTQYGAPHGCHSRNSSGSNFLYVQPRRFQRTAMNAETSCWCEIDRWTLLLVCPFADRTPLSVLWFPFRPTEPLQRGWNHLQGMEWDIVRSLRFLWVTSDLSIHKSDGPGNMSLLKCGDLHYNAMCRIWSTSDWRKTR